MASCITAETVVSYTAFSPLRALRMRSASAVYLCCTFPGVASAGRYPASCPVKPGLSSAVRNLNGRDRLSASDTVLL